MKIGETISRLNRVQHGLMFKIIASIVLTVLVIGGGVAYYVSVTAPGGLDAAAFSEALTEATSGVDDQTRATIEARAKAVEELVASDRGAIMITVGCLLAVALLQVIVWLGLGITYLVAFVLAGLIALLLDPFSGMGRLLLGVVTLSTSFAVFIELARFVLSAPTPVFAVARNVLDEAVRMKISLVFIVLLILGLALLPGMLDESSPLRYRVQSFLQYSTGGSFWVIAILTIFFSVASLTFEQRDRVIWQTVTKPVAAWQYILGKWLGVMVLNIILLGVSSSAIFMFTEYLRVQPAIGERTPFETVGTTLASEDRLLLETQVLAARRVISAAPPDFDEERFSEMVEERLAAELRARELDDTPRNRDLLRDPFKKALRTEAITTYRSIAPMQSEAYVFDGLGEVRDTNQVITLRYRIDAGSNRPDEVYRLGFRIGQNPPFTEIVGLAVMHSIPLPTELISEDGRLRVEIFNGDYANQIPNTDSIYFPPEGLKLYYAVGSYHMNFMRVVVVLWLKLAFLAIVAITAATFLNFPVACMVAFATFLAAEGASFMFDSLEYYGTIDKERNVIFYKVVIHAIAITVAGSFKTYSELKPTTHLVDGLLISWWALVRALSVVGITSVLLYGVSVSIFRKRELATYSGH